MEKKKIIELLNLDLQDEHGAIIQYLSHAYGMGEGEVACEIEAIAREEMRHLDWLAETIVALGGKPSLERGTMNMAGKTVPEWMSNDVGLEQGAIDHYGEHIRAIDDPRVKRLLQRIVADERAHHGKFEHFIEKAKKEGLKDIRGNRSDSLSRSLNWGVGHEYTVILQYMFHSYMTPDPEARKQLEDQAVNEMQHLGWLAEELVDSGGSPVIEHTAVDRATGAAAMLRADIKVEKEVHEKYGRIADEVDDAGTKALIQRIRNNEGYHIEVFNDLLKEAEGK
ncbi:MAG TPA: ferritin-like domain-containing protein [Dehalococcoidales bacterium]|nr:MAG: bacterioferritin [Chloroflexi bacterium RBG_16_60_22]HJX12146.1 ferritin-like domain-containing protein [Dehalococcoidales bacterium]